MKEIDFSIIVPAYNEAGRIKPFLKDLYIFSKTWKNYELLFVDDGSTDNTLEILKDFASKNKKTRIVSYKPNKGKAFAVKKGVEASKGRKVIFIDADGSISPKEIPGMVSKLDSFDVVVGSRAKKESKVQAVWLRKFTGFLFNNYVNLLFNIRIDDVLCGFKGFKRKIALDLFKDLKSAGWIFDVELFYKARKKGYSLYELPILWIHKGGSKMKFTHPFKMFFQMIKLRMDLKC
jgi:dolichyl-phosphate beta-glucosyltransferase